MEQKSERLYWIDWLRVIAVLLIFPFHASRVFDVIEPFYAKSPLTSFPLSVFPMGFFTFWQMQLLFLLAGMSSYFALAKRGGYQYLRERTLRLLIPFVFGYLIIVPPQAWYGARTNAGYTGSLLQFYGDYFALRFGRISDYFGGPGTGHLWFIEQLFIISAIALPLMLWMRKGRGTPVAEKTARLLANQFVWFAVVLVLLCGMAIPEFGGHPLANYLVWFLAGFVLMFDSAALERAEKWRWWLLAAGVVVSLGTLATYEWRYTLPDPSAPVAIHEYFVQLTGWLLILAALGLGRRYLTRSTSALPYLSEASYPTYILHQTVIVAAGFYLVRVLPSPLPSWGVLTIASLAVCYGIYELLIRRWNPMRFLFGMHPKPKPAE